MNTVTDTTNRVNTDPDPNTEHISQLAVGKYRVWVVCRYITGTMRQVYTQDGNHWSANAEATAAHVDNHYILRKLEACKGYPVFVTMDTGDLSLHA
jgi:hypothetical protein